MKKIIIVFLTVFTFAIAPSVMAEEILDFTEKIVIREDASIEVSEVITYDFGQEKKHGIFRDIPYKYKVRGGNYKLRLENIHVTNGAGEERPFSVSTSGDDRKIKIGDRDALVSGKQVYKIDYTVKRAINFFENHDELYWNVTGDKWPVKIRQAKSTVIFPANIAEDDLETKCFSGSFASNARCVSKRYVYEGAGQAKEVVFIDDVSQAGHGFTIVVGLPKGIIKQPGIVVRIWDTIKDNLILLLPLLVFIYMFRLWQKKGRDAEGRGTIVAQFEAPDNLSPMGVGTIVDMRADNKDFSANIISLAVKGYLKIVKVQKGTLIKRDDYAFVSKESKQELRKSEKNILKAIFKNEYIETDSKKKEELKLITEIPEEAKVVFLSSLKNSFYKDLKDIKADIKKELIEAGYFDKKADKEAIKYSVVGFIILAGAIMAGDILGALFMVSLIASAISIIIFGLLLTRRTKKGVLAKEYILGLKRYLEVAEKDRLDFHNAPEKNPQTFEKLLPYAIALGVEKKWAKQFEDIFKDTQVDWYSSYDASTFSALALADGLSSFSSRANSVASSSPSSASSGGSGFSGGGVGGGFGGGGGGSW